MLSGADPRGVRVKKYLDSSGMTSKFLVDAEAAGLWTAL